MEAQASELRAEIAEQAEEAGRVLGDDGAPPPRSRATGLPPGCGRSWLPSSGACGRWRRISPTAPAATGRSPDGCGSRVLSCLFMLDIPVELGSRRYVISVGHGISRLLQDLLADYRGRKTVLVASRRVHALHGRAVERSLRGLGSVHVTLVPDGERFKSRPTLESLYDAFLEAHLGRDGLVVAFGGGVVGDIAGYAAATWMRGVDWVGIPTTLLSMVDSSIGGKVGINHAKAKNMVGAFHQPRSVVIDPASSRHSRCASFVQGVRAPEVRDPRGPRSLRLPPRGAPGRPRLGPRRDGKRDRHGLSHQGRGRGEGRARGRAPAHPQPRPYDRPRPRGGHLLRRYTHGEAVGWGLVGAAFLALRRGLLPETGCDAIASAVDHVGPRPPVSDLEPQAILGALARDKKAKAGRVPFVLPTAIGQVEVCDDVSRAEIRRALRVMAGREALPG